MTSLAKEVRWLAFILGWVAATASIALAVYIVKALS